MVTLRILVLLSSLWCLPVQCWEACLDDELTSFVQTSALLHTRGPPAHGRLIRPVDLANVQIAANSEQRGIPFEPYVNEWYDLYVQQKERTTDAVLAICLIVILTVSGGWLSFWWMTKNGEQMPGLRLVLLISSFGIGAWGMNVLNKSLVTYWGTPTLVTAAQMSFSALATLLWARGRIHGELRQMFKWCVIPFLFFAMLVSAFFTFQYLTLSMLMIIRNMGPLLTLPTESLVMPPDKRPYVTMQMLMALTVISASTIVYCGHIKVSLHGVALATLNMVIAVADRVAQRRLLTTECQGLPTETCVLLNNVVGLVPTVALAMWWGEYRYLDTKRLYLSVSVILLVLSGVIGTGICYFAIAVQREITATSFMVVQNMVRVAVVAVGVFIFADPIGWPFQVVGLLMSFTGALWYGKAQIDGATEVKRTELAAAEASKASAKAQSDFTRRVPAKGPPVPAKGQPVLAKGQRR